LLIHETADEPVVYASAGIERPAVSSAGAAVESAAAVRIPWLTSRLSGAHRNV
jgi:hypothetical protein